MTEQTQQNTHSSLVARLNARLVVRLLGIFLCLDVALCLLGLLGVYLWTEDRGAEVAALVEAYGLPAGDAARWTEAGGYTVTPLEREPQGTDMGGWAVLPAATREGLRSVSGLSSSLLRPFWQLEKGDARLVIELEGYAVTLDIAGPLRLLSVAMQGVLLYQLLSLIFNVFKNAGTIRKVLSPIQELAHAATRLGQAPEMSPEELRDMAQRLGEIDHAHLDARIPVEGAQRELKHLAQAINAMLDRIDRSYQAQTRFVSDASHELRTPIAVIQGYAKLLSRWGKDDPATLQEAIDAIVQEAEAMGELVEQLLFLARGDNDSLTVEREVFDLTQVAEQVYRDTRLIDAAHPMTVQWERPVYVHSDPGLIKQAVRVLVDNAVKYTPEGGGILLTVEERDGNARLSVTDEGIGIESQDIPHIFDRFFRADRSRDRRTGGSGLGLSIAKWIVDRHGGWLEVTSRPGAGTRMTMVLPSAEGVAAENARNI